MNFAPSSRASYLLQHPRKEIDCSLIRIIESIPLESVTLIWVKVAFACELLHSAKAYELLSIDDWNDFIELAMEDKERRHTLEFVEEFIRQTPVPIGNCSYWYLLRSGR
jgi:hypothetical protein